MALTKDKKQTLCALFHDLGTPAFSHVVDFMFNDPTNQASSEKKISTIIQNSDEIMSYLKSDSIRPEEVDDPMQYSIVDCYKR